MSGQNILEQGRVNKHPAACRGSGQMCQTQGNLAVWMVRVMGQPASCSSQETNTRYSKEKHLMGKLFSITEAK